MAPPGGYAAGTLTMAALLTALTSSQGLLTTASKTGGSYAYNFATVPFLAEALKLGISYNLLRRQRKEDPKAAQCTTNPRTVALFLVPSIIYMLHNNVQVCDLCLGECWSVHALHVAGWLLAAHGCTGSNHRGPGRAGSCL